jgi:hypothetical protein
MRQSVKRAAVIGTALAVMTGGGVAYAAWVASGTGTATAKATTAQQLTTEVATASADLYPGATGDLRLTISNPNGYPVRVTRVAPNGDVTGSGGTGVCAVPDVTFTEQTGLTLDVPATGSASFTLADSVQMGNNSDDGCQGATFTVPVSMSGASNAS